MLSHLVSPKQSLEFTVEQLEYYSPGRRPPTRWFLHVTPDPPTGAKLTSCWRSVILKGSQHLTLVSTRKSTETLEIAQVPQTM